LYDFGEMGNRMALEAQEEEEAEEGNHHGGFLSFIGEDYMSWLKG
jgi:hypothetical protein